MDSEPKGARVLLRVSIALSLCIVGCVERPGLPGGPLGAGDDGGTRTSTSALCSTAPRLIASVAGAWGTHLVLDRSPKRAGPVLYWATPGRDSATSSLWRTDVRAASTTVLARGASSLVGLDGDALVWTSGGERRLHALSTATLTDVDLGVSLAEYDGGYTRPLLATSGGYVLWSDGRAGGGAYYALSLRGGAPERYRLSHAWVVPSSIGAFGDSLFWVSDGSLWRALLPDSRGLTRVATGVGQAEIIDVRGDSAYLDGVVRVSLRDGATRPLVGLDLGATPPSSDLCGGRAGKYGSRAVAVGGDEAIYETQWTDCLGGTPGFALALWQAKVDVRQPARLAGFLSSQDAPLPVAVDDAGCLFYIRNDSGAARRASLMTVATGAATPR